MKTEKAAKIAKWADSAEIQKWSAAIGQFMANIQPQVASAMGQTCKACPFRNLLNVGGCLAEDCPVHQVMHTLNRAVPRAVMATKEIYQIKYSRKTA